MVTEKLVVAVTREQVQDLAILCVRDSKREMPLFENFPSVDSSGKIWKPCSVVNISDLERVSGDVVDAESLKAAS